MNEFSYSQTNLKHFNSENNSINLSRFDSIINCHDTNLLIIKTNKQYGIIDKNGIEIVKPYFDEIVQPNEYESRFSTDFVLKKDNQYRIVNPEGELLTDTNLVSYYWDIFDSYNEDFDQIFILKRKDNKFGVISETGETLIPFIYDSIQKFERKPLCIVKKGEYYGLVNYKNKVIVNSNCEKIYSWRNFPYYILKKNGKESLINYRGEQLIDSLYSSIRPCSYDFENERYIVEKNKRFGVVNIKGKIIVPIIYDKLSNWVEWGPDAHFVTKDNRKGIISRDGKILIPTKYDEIEYYNDNNVIVKQGNKLGILTIMNTMVIPLEYDAIYLDWFDAKIKKSKNYKIYVRKNNAFYILNNKNEIIDSVIKDEKIIKKLIDKPSH